MTSVPSPYLNKRPSGFVTPGGLVVDGMKIGAPSKEDAAPEDAERLPAAVRRKMDHLTDLALDCRARSGRIIAQRTNADDEVGKLERRRRELLAPLGEGGGNLAEDDARVVRLDRDLADARETAARAQDAYENNTAEAEPLIRLRAACSAAVERARNLHGAAVPLHSDTVTPDPAKGESLADFVERQRRRLRELAAEAVRVAAARRDRKSALAGIVAEIDALAARGEPALDGFVEPGGEGKIGWPAQYQGVSQYDSDVAAGVRIPNVPAMFAWLFHNALVAKVTDQVETEYADGDGGLTDRDRAAKLAEIARDRLAVERIEEAGIVELEAQGTMLARRGEADPRAVLGLADNVFNPE